MPRPMGKRAAVLALVDMPQTSTVVIYTHLLQPHSMLCAVALLVSPFTYLLFPPASFSSFCWRLLLTGIEMHRWGWERLYPTSLDTSNPANP